MRRRILAVLVAMSGTALGQGASDSEVAAELRSMSLADMLQVDISTGTSKFLHQAPGVAYVITAEDIARLGARNVLEVLQGIPGLNTHLFQAVVNSPLADMRGVVSERGGYLLFLRDGRPLRLLSNNTMPEVYRLPVHFIERIEVVRGPASAVYGADALAGAINIITRSQPSGAGLRAAEEDERAGWAGLHGSVGELDWSMAVSGSRYDDLIDTRRRAMGFPNGRRFDQVFGQAYTDLDVKVKAHGFRAEFWALNYHKRETGNPANPRGFTDVRTAHRHADLAYAGALSSTTDWSADVFYTYFNGTRQNEIMQGQPTNGDNGEERTTANVSVTDRRFAGHRLRVAAGFTHERRANYLPPPPPPPGAPAPVVQPNSRNLHYLSLQDEFAFASGWELTTGARVDHYADLGAIPSARAALVWSITPRLTAKLLYSDGFHAPGPALANNHDTPYERMKNLEAALDWRPDTRWRVALNTYRYRARDLLVQGGPTARPVGREGTGGELELSWLPAPTLKVETALTLLSAEDSASGARAPYTPRTALKAALAWRPAQRWQLHLRGEAYRDRARSATDLRPPLEDFALLHATLAHELTARASLQLAVHNALDRRPFVPLLGAGNNDDYRLPGRRLALTLDVRF